MPKSIFCCEYKLKKSTSIEDFLNASKKLNDEYIKKQKGYISWKQLNDCDTWVDLITFETIEDLKSFEANSETSPNTLALEFYSYINMPSCKIRYYNILRAYDATSQE